MTDGNKLSDAQLWEEYYTNLHHAHHALRQAFLKSGLTQDQLADRLGVDKGLISKRLKGNDNLTLKTISFMATAIGCRLKIEPVAYDQVRSRAIETTANISSSLAIGNVQQRLLGRASDAYGAEKKSSPNAGAFRAFMIDKSRQPKSVTEGKMKSLDEKSIREPHRLEAA